MFGPGTTLLAIVALAMLSAGGIGLCLPPEPHSDRGTGGRSGRSNPEPVGGRYHRGVAIGQSGQTPQVDSGKPEGAGRSAKAKAKRDTAPPLPLRLQQAGLGWSRRSFIIFSVVIGVFSLLVSVILGGPLYAAVAIGVAGFLGLPRWFVNRLRKCRFKKFMDEFPNAVDIIVRGVKAGLPLNDCVRMIAVESAEPVRGEFRVVSEAQSVGLSLSEAVE